MTGEIEKPKTWKNVGIRAITALTMAAICFVPFYFGGIAWTLLVLILGVWLIWEWVQMTDPEAGNAARIIPLLALIFVITYQYTGEVAWIIPALLAAGALAFFERQRRSGEARWAPFGIFYIILPSVSFIALRGSDLGFHDHGFKLVVFLVLIVIAADVGAYFGGSYFKGPKLFPKISPKKTWSGLISGIFAGMIMGALCSVFLKMGPVTAALIALPIVILSVLGDFVESAIKRRMNVKDAGDILPGHGGLLDRLDSLVFVILAAMLLVHIYPIWNLI